MKQSKIASYQDKKYRVQLIKLVKEDPKYYKYQLLINRKVVYTSISEYICRKQMAQHLQSIILQLKL